MTATNTYVTIVGMTVRRELQLTFSIIFFLGFFKYEISWKFSFSCCFLILWRSSAIKFPSLFTFSRSDFLAFTLIAILHSFLLVIRKQCRTTCLVNPTVYTVKRVDEVVRHLHLVTQDQFTQVSKKVSDIPEENFTTNIELSRHFSQVSNQFAIITFPTQNFLDDSRRQNWKVSKAVVLGCGSNFVLQVYFLALYHCATLPSVNIQSLANNYKKRRQLTASWTSSVEM